jgi:hypothetical protein
VQFNEYNLNIELFSISDDFFRLVNAFTLGDFFHVSEKADMSKLQMAVGRGHDISIFNQLGNLGGGGGNPGPYSNVWFYFSKFGFIYWFFCIYL